MEHDVVAGVAELRLEGCVDLDRVHARDADGEEPRQHSEAGTDLEHDVAGIELREPLDHAEDVLVHEEVLAERLLRRDVHSPKQVDALRSIWRSSSPGSSPRACASACSVCTTYAGSFRFPRTGCGARYGASVSARILSAGTSRAARRRSTAFGKLALPANETYHLRSSAVGRRCGDEKQCSTTRPLKPLSAASVSSSAARV